ncbi:hypothetical protein DZF79_26255 [Vibrio parahaemolyticus]|nr:hypothetical protein [Vibrio parahaemolyticus]
MRKLSEKENGLCKTFGCVFINSIIDAVMAVTALIIGSKIVLLSLNALLPENKTIETIFGEAIGPLTLLVAPFLLCSFCGLVMLAQIKEDNCILRWLKARLINITSGFHGIIISIVGFIGAQWIWLDGKKPDILIWVIGGVSLLLFSLFSAIEETFEKEDKLPIGWFTLFVIIVTLGLTFLAV